MKKKFLIIVVTALVLLTACNKAEQKPVSTATETKEVIFTGNEFSFQPNTVNLKAGETVKIVFKNQGKFVHDLVIERTEQKTKQIGPNEEDSFLFTPEKAGTYAIYCSVAGHRDFGMEGSLIVE
ncbi:cupredoxin domain-containing protein [Candidatus Peregrinibacteria bacterium]|nr:cupredoxin domain-containing protein [Candidatus Peregrinibacteria bacterium]